MALPITETVYDVTILRAKVDRILDFTPRLMDGNKLFDKYSKTLGVFQPSAGKAGTFYIIREYPNLKTRLEAREKMIKDQEIMKYYKETSPMLMFIETFVCKAPPTLPMGQINPRSHFIIQKLKTKKFSMFAVQQHKDMTERMTRTTGVDFTPFGVLFPIMHDEHCIFTLFEVPENTVCERYQKRMELLRDPKEWHTLAQMQESFEVETNMLLTPLDVNRIGLIVH